MHIAIIVDVFRLLSPLSLSLSPTSLSPLPSHFLSFSQTSRVVYNVVYESESSCRVSLLETQRIGCDVAMRSTTRTDSDADAAASHAVVAGPAAAMHLLLVMMLLQLQLGMHLRSMRQRTGFVYRTCLRNNH